MPRNNPYVGSPAHFDYCYSEYQRLAPAEQQRVLAECRRRAAAMGVPFENVDDDASLVRVFCEEVAYAGRRLGRVGRGDQDATVQQDIRARSDTNFDFVADSKSVEAYGLDAASPRVPKNGKDTMNTPRHTLQGVKPSMFAPAKPAAGYPSRFSAFSRYEPIGQVGAIEPFARSAGGIEDGPTLGTPEPWPETKEERLHMSYVRQGWEQDRQRERAARMKPGTWRGGGYLGLTDPAKGIPMWTACVATVVAGAAGFAAARYLGQRRNQRR